MLVCNLCGRWPPSLGVVGKCGFWTNSTPSFHEGVLIVWGGVILRVSPMRGGGAIWGGANFKRKKGEKREKGEFFNFSPLKIWFLGFFTKIFNFWIFWQKASKYSSFEIFEVDFWFLAPDPYFLGFFLKNFNFWIFLQKASKYSSFEIFSVDLTPSPLFFATLVPQIVPQNGGQKPKINLKYLKTRAFWGFLSKNSKI